MVYNLNTRIKDFEGKDIPIDETKPGSPALTFKRVIATALNINQPTIPMTPEERSEAFFIILKAHEKPEAVEYKAEEIALIKRIVNQVYTPLVSGRTDQFFDQVEKEKLPPQSN